MVVTCMSLVFGDDWTCYCYSRPKRKGSELVMRGRGEWREKRREEEKRREGKGRPEGTPGREDEIELRT